MEFVERHFSFFELLRNDPDYVVLGSSCVDSDNHNLIAISRNPRYIRFIREYSGQGEWKHQIFVEEPFIRELISCLKNPGNCGTTLEKEIYRNIIKKVIISPKSCDGDFLGVGLREDDSKEEFILEKRHLQELSKFLYNYYKI